MKAVIMLILALFVLVQDVSAKEVNAVSIKGYNIKVGALWDDMVPVMKKLKKYQKKFDVTYTDPSNPGAGNVVSAKHSYQVDNKKIAVIYARTSDPGPFRITKIIVN
jgi:hypothetical protein